MKCKYCLQNNVVKNGRLSYDQYYKCKDCNRYFRHTLLDDANPKEIQELLDSGVHKYAIARKYGCTHNKKAQFNQTSNRKIFVERNKKNN